MEKWKIDYSKLLELNFRIQRHSDLTYWLCVTRTVQESKLFPVPPYMLLSYLNAYYRWPDLLRKVGKSVSPEVLGDRAREMSTKMNTINVGWCLPNFYTLGREFLINHDIVRPEDNIEDLYLIHDWSHRFNLSYHRADAHGLNTDMEHRSQLLSEKTLQVLEADLFSVTPNDELHTTAMKLMAQLTQFSFLAHCECRIGVCNHGPYKIGGRSEMVIRHWYDLAEGDFPWLDDIAPDLIYNNLVIPIIMKDTHFTIIDDWGSFECEPEYNSENIIALGLYTSDFLSDGYIPVGMESREKLLEIMKGLIEELRKATVKLWKRIAGWSRDQILDSGALVYYSANKDFAHVAGVYDPQDWMTIDPRADRFRPMFNDEYARDCLGEMVGLITMPHQGQNEYYMAKYSDARKEMLNKVPYSILVTGDYTERVNEPDMVPAPGICSLPPKKGLYTVSGGKFTLDELNAKSKDYVPEIVNSPWNFYDDKWVKYHFDSPEADELYKMAQDKSRLLKGRGSKLNRELIHKIRKENGETLET